MALPRRYIILAVALAWLCRPGGGHAAPAPALPPHLPRYSVDIDLDIARRTALVRQVATWTNPTATPTDTLVLNAHSRYVVPGSEIGFMAKMLEILRVQPSEALGYNTRPCEVRAITLGGQPLHFHFEGDTETDLVVQLPKPVGPGESVTVVLDLTMHLPEKQGRWGHWEGVTTLSNWLPVFAYYGCKHFGPKPCLPNHGDRWQPVPFIPWHQPFLNESGVYDVRVTLPCEQVVATSGTIRATEQLPGGKQRLHIEAAGVREFTFLCSHRFKVFEGVCPAGPNGAPVRIHVAAFPEHEFYAEHMVRIAAAALTEYSRQLGPYPWEDFTVSEAFFGWNGNECSTLVMIDERVFAMPHVAVGYVEYLLTHEICHQWWYNLVGDNGYCETWMDEGFANYLSHRLLTCRHGKNNALMSYPAGLEWLPNIRRDDYRSAGMYATLGKKEMSPVVQEIPKFGHLANLFNVCYDKGGRLVGMIEDRLGEAAFFDFLRIVVRKYAYRVISIRDFQCELEQYTGRSWEEFFRRWLYECGMSDWAVEKVGVTRAPKGAADRPRCCLLARKLLFARGARPDDDEVVIPPGGVKLTVILHQKGDYDEPTTLGIAMSCSDKYPIRIPILPGVDQPYRTDDPPARITPLEKGKNGGTRLQVEVVLPEEPCQVAVDPDQVLPDTQPANNFWHTPIRWRITPCYTFLEETDLTTAYDRWNVMLGPWLYTQNYQTAWANRSTMAGLRAGVYRTQEFSGGAYVGYRATWRDVLVGVDGQWEHWPFPKSQTGFFVERRLAEFNNGDEEALRGVAWTRYIFTYNASLYLPPIHFIEAYGQYTDNFLPFPTQTAPGSVRYDRTSTLGLHYRLNYLTPYWDPEGGFSIDAWAEAGVAEEPSSVGLTKIGGQFAAVKSPPNLGFGPLQGLGDWFADTRFAVRLYGATASPSKGEFFTMGGSELFRGFDLAQRQGSSVWVGSVEWRVPLARRTHIDCLDHVMSVRNVHAAAFYDIGDTYAAGRSVGPVAHGVGVGLRLDVAWFSFVERTTLRIDFAKAINLDTGPQVWLGVNHPF
jgi:hypothetical protein